MSCYILTRNKPCGTSVYLQAQATHHRSPACSASTADGMLRGRSAVARQPARRPLSTMVAAQPGPHLDPPPAVSEAWVASQRAWIDLAMNQPVELSGTNDKEVAWTSCVHVLGVSHHSAANPRLWHTLRTCG
ncbi:hypothetical protein FOA52_003358 [Chlamydomonas sp. UWO 241]|nr:hypothetical protein FOA52_003358 [Chlamydomonas sp. UWO 241]